MSISLKMSAVNKKHSNTHTQAEQSRVEQTDILLTIQYEAVVFLSASLLEDMYVA